jgi:hypothetical protein
MELPKHEKDSLTTPIKLVKINSFDIIFEQYGLNGNFFNPDKISPPNAFVSKLENRMKNYYQLLKKTDKS